jgi:hypothetical protein
MEGDALDIYKKVLSGDAVGMKSLLAAGFDPNCKMAGHDKRSILELSLRTSSEVARVLIEARADVNGLCSYVDNSQYQISFLSSCYCNGRSANLLIRHGLKLTPLEGVLTPTPRPRNPFFFEFRTAYRVLHKRKSRCFQVCAVLLHRSNLRCMSLDLRRDWIKRMIWPTRFDKVWAARDDPEIPPEFEECV